MNDNIRTEMAEIREHTSMDHWWPILRDIDVPMPATIRLDITEEREFQDGLALPVPDEAELREAISDVGGPPAFLRSDQTSTKHKMRDGSLVEDDGNPISNAAGVVEQHHLSMGMPMPSSFYVREYLDLWHQFKSFADGATPIAAEARVFLLGGNVWDWGFYWPEDAIWDRTATSEDWRAALDRTEQRVEDGWDTFHEYAERVGVEFSDNYWSVDFALTTDGEWVCIDMARGEVSFHPEGVYRAEEDPRQWGTQ